MLRERSQPVLSQGFRNPRQTGQLSFAPVPGRWAPGGLQACAGGMSPYYCSTCCPPTGSKPLSLLFLHLPSLLLLVVKAEKWKKWLNLWNQSLPLTSSASLEITNNKSLMIMCGSKETPDKRLHRLLVWIINNNHSVWSFRAWSWVLWNQCV